MNYSVSVSKWRAKALRYLQGSVVESFRLPRFAFIHRYNMRTRNLAKIFNSKSIALIWASDTSGKPGYIPFINLNQGVFKSLIHQVANMREGKIYSSLAYAT